MSAALIIKQSASVHLLTDASLIGPDLRLIGVMAKVVQLPHLHAAVTARCSSSLDLGVMLQLGTAPDLAAIRVRCVEVVELVKRGGGALEIHVAGLEQSFIVAESGATEIDAFGMAPTCDVARAHLAGRAPDDLDPEADGLRALELMRSNAACAGIGGFAQCTSIFANRIVTKILKRWPDRVGDFATGQKGAPGAGIFAGFEDVP